MYIKSLHGFYQFDLQRFKGDASDYLSTLKGGFGKDYESIGLQKYRTRYANLLPYRKLCNNINDQIGSRGYSNTHLQKKIRETGVLISKIQVSHYAGLQLSIPFIHTDFDLYDEAGDEILLFEDGISVKRQKDIRNKPDYEKPTKRVQTDILALEQPNHNYRYICPLLLNNDFCLDDILSAEWTIAYGCVPKNLVVISDGAKNIRNRLLRVFNQTPVIILDWYHLKKKVNEFFSMMGLKKEEKKEHIKNILHYLWHGEYEKAHSHINLLVKPHKTRNYKKEELIGYLDKHRVEIINYDRRKKNGKTVGSGKAETTVNQIVGVRQKKKGSSWTPDGSKALAIIKTLELNREFEQFWENQIVA